MTRLEFETLPRLGALYRKALFRRRSGRGLVAIPRIEAEVRAVTPDAASLRAYRALTQDPTVGVLPICYPHILASPLHAAILATSAFPYKILGLIHVENTITEHRPIVEGEILRLTCCVEGAAEASKGVTFDFHTEVWVGTERVWESASRILRLTSGAGSKTGKKRAPHVPGDLPGADRSVIWRLPPNLGRRYAKISGDYNPIHLTPLTAKLFGFKRPIIHGMWSLARCVAELGSNRPPGSRTLSARFKRPVFLPGRVLMTARQVGEGTTFRLASADGRIPHLEGREAASSDEGVVLR